MNKIAGFAGSKRSIEERDLLLRDRLCSNGSNNVTVIHPSESVSVAWLCDNRFFSYKNKNDLYAFVYGSIYKINMGSERTKKDSGIDDCAEDILNSYSINRDRPGNYGGSYLIVAGMRDGSVIMSGDPAGNRQLFYINKDNETIFASHPLICARISGETEVDRSLEDFLLIYGFLPEGRTPYKGVFQLPAGKEIRCENTGKYRLSNIKSTNLEDERKKTTSYDLLLSNLYDKIVQCTEDQLPSDKKVGVLLGGFDSALVASLLSCYGKQVYSYSFRYQNTEFNQPHVEAMAKEFGFKHKWVDITPDVIANGIKNYAEEYTQPTNWLNYVIQTTHVCKVMRMDGISYAFSGDGCDTLFLGYPGTYLRTNLFARLPKIPDVIMLALIGLFGHPILDRKIGHPYRVAMGMLRSMAYDMPARAFLTYRAMDIITVLALRDGDNPSQDEPVDSIVQRLAAQHADKPIQRLGYISKSMVSPNKVKLAAAIDVAGVNVQSPYNHPSLREFATTIPEELLREEAQNSLVDKGKLCLMKMAEKYRLLPREVIYQPKLAAIDSPIDEWFENELSVVLDHALSGLPFEPDRLQLEAMKKRTIAERLYKSHIGSTRVISDAISLLATYGSMCSAIKSHNENVE